MCLCNKKADVLKFLKEKPEVIRCWKIVLRNHYSPNDLFSKHYHKKWYVGLNESDSKLIKPCLGNCNIKHGIHVFIKKPARRIYGTNYNILIQVTARKADLIGVNFEHNEACFKQVKLSKLAYNKAIQGNNDE